MADSFQSLWELAYVGRPDDMWWMLRAEELVELASADGVVQRQDRLPLAATRAELRGPLGNHRPMLRPRLAESLKTCTTLRQP